MPILGIPGEGSGKIGINRKKSGPPPPMYINMHIYIIYKHYIYTYIILYINHIISLPMCIIWDVIQVTRQMPRWVTNTFSYVKI